MDKMLRDPEKYFSQFDKLLPSGLSDKDTVLLYRISNIEVMKKIIARNPHARYTIFDDKHVNGMCKALGLENVEKYVDATVYKTKDAKTFDYTKFTWACFEWHPISNKPTDFLKIGLKPGQKLYVFSKDGKTEYGHSTIVDGRSVDFNGKTMSMLSFWRNANPIKDLKLYGTRLKHGIDRMADLYPAFIMVDQEKSVHDYYLEWMLSQSVVNYGYHGS